MKKSIWIVLPIVIIAIVLIAVFIGQRNSLSDQVAQLQQGLNDLNAQLSDANMATKTEQELRVLAETDRDSLNELVQEAETRATEAVEALNAVTTERDTLQANADNAAAQLNAGIQQVQEALNVLTGGVVEEGPTADELAAELEKTQQALEEANAQKAAAEEALANAANEETQAALAQAQEALAAVSSERDQLKAAVDAAAAQAAELAAVTAERDELQKTAENAKIVKAVVKIYDAEENEAAVYEDIAEFKLDELKLPQGVYTISIIVYNAAEEEAARYDLPYISAGEEEAAEAEQPAAEEAAEAEQPAAEEPAEEPAEAPAEENAEQPAEEAAEEAPVEENGEEPAEEAEAEEQPAA